MTNQQHHVVGIPNVLVDEGFALIKVPLNSPDPVASIALLAGRYAAPVLVGGGVHLEAIAPWRAARAHGFGLGSALYAPCDAPQVVHARARTFVVALS